MVQIKNKKIRWIVSAFFALLILFGTYHSIFSLAAFLLMCLFVVFFDRESVLQQLVFIMPMATIFKMSPSSQSFFTMILLLYVVLNFVLPQKATLMIVLFAVYVFVGQLLSGGFELFRTVKLINNILFLSSVLNSKVTFNHKELFYSNIFGNIISSGMALMESDVFPISRYVGVKGVGGLEFIDLTRFKGLYGDPNYYTVGIVISLCLLIVLYHRKEIKSIMVVLLGTIMVYFLIMTYSKSAILALFVLLVFLMYSLIKRKKAIASVVVIGVVVLVSLFALAGKIEMLNVVIERFSTSDTIEGADLNNLTTGRLDIWTMYVKQLFGDLFLSFFGNGINSEVLNEHAAHNTYLDMWYYLGVIGSFLFIFALIFVIRQSEKVRFERNILNYSVLISVLFLYFGLSELFYFDMAFHLFFSFIVLNLPISIETNSIVFNN